MHPSSGCITGPEPITVQGPLLQIGEGKREAREEEK